MGEIETEMKRKKTGRRKETNRDREKENRRKRKMRDREKEERRKIDKYKLTGETKVEK